MKRKFESSFEKIFYQDNGLFEVVASAETVGETRTQQLRVDFVMRSADTSLNLQDDAADNLSDWNGH